MPRPTRERLAVKPGKRNRGLLWGGGILLVVGAIFAAFRIFGTERHAYEVAWPESAPTGEPVAVGVPRPGDVFRTVVETQNRIALAADYDDPSQGMQMDAKLEVVHEVSAREGGGTRSTMRWTLIDAASNIPGKQTELRVVLGSTDPFTVVRERDEAGTPVEGPAADLGGTVQARALELLFSGFVDPTLSFLPRGRRVRVGEAWKLFEEVSDLPGMDRAVRIVTETSGEGFPVLSRAGVVKAEAVEDHAGQRALRLRVVFSLSMEGDTHAPAPPGHVSLGGKGEGPVWVSLATGLPLEVRLDSTLRSTLRREGRANVERAINQSIRSTTR